MVEHSVGSEDDLFKTFKNEHREVSKLVELALSDGEYCYIGADGNRIYLSTLLNELACIKCVGLLECYIKGLAQLTNSKTKPRPQNFESIGKWLEEELNIKIEDCIHPTELIYLKMLFEYRHIIVHNWSRCDEKFLKELRRLYEEMGWNEVPFLFELEKRAILNPDQVEPMKKIIYTLIDGIHKKYNESRE